MAVSPTLSRKIRVMAVDDSALMRAIMTHIVNQNSDMEMIGTAPDPLIARQMIKDLNPDVLTLDIEMPKMDGLDFLSRLMRLRPMPVVMVSSLTHAHSEISLRALELGAAEVVGKPCTSDRASMQIYAEQLTDKIRAAAAARLGLLPHGRPAEPVRTTAVLSGGLGARSNWLIAIGASTGGTEAISTVLRRFPEQCPPVVMTQHMPAGFTASFVQRLDKLCAITVHEAQDGQRIEPGNAYLAPGGIAHLAIKRVNGELRAQLIESDPVNRHRPSVDVLFQSVAQVMGNRASAALLTGMGKDGAKGLLAMREAGADTIVQDEASCVVFGMPKEALAIGASDEAVPLEQIAARLYGGKKAAAIP
ncbi:chemotaxis response regulator protein-glutamate methylesterase [Bordetella sp. 15P40C-2]|uniref:protein-glutamate methylesterase/protein-glutamine glutaminase n=1 Tax=Bordetella sp. 15P40C-2 TaxID=2572246 RepID=UPI001320FADE|nr:chemotaxis response regulator protein-glutamate methylesterase [Bordetella sp. 15P40C-2]MVW70021.1 chemotaxis-specific protein-glutamate methyltransferase CheB [Bordetella sp. 15P40C-2]